MKSFLFVLVIAIIAASCSSKSGKLVPKTREDLGPISQINYDIDMQIIRKQRDSMRMDSMVHKYVADLAVRHPKSFQYYYHRDTVNKFTSKQWSVMIAPDSQYTVFSTGYQMIWTYSDNVMATILTQLKVRGIYFELEKRQSDKMWLIKYSGPVLYAPIIPQHSS